MKKEKNRAEQVRVRRITSKERTTIFHPKDK